MRRLNRFVQDEEPWKLAKDEGAAERLDQVLYSLAEGLRVGLGPPASVHAGVGRAAAWRARSGGAVDGGGGLRLAPGRGHHGAALAALPAHRAGSGVVVDTHCHLDACDPPDAELVANARAVGVNRIATVGMNDAVDRARDRRRSMSTTAWCAIVGRHPHDSEGWSDSDIEPIERAAADPRARAIGETGLDYFRDRAPHADQRRAFEAHIDLATRSGLPLVVHTREAEDDTFDDPARSRRGPHGGPPLLLGARPPGGVRRARLHVLVRGQRHLHEGHGPAGRRARPARRAAADRDRLALPRAAARARQAERAGERGHHRGDRRGPARHLLRGPRRRWSSATPRGCSRGNRGAAQRAGQPPAHPRVRRAAQPRAGPELPDRRQHPGRDRARRRARSGRRGARGGRRRGRAVGVPRPARRPSARGGDRPLARAGAAGRPGAVPQRHAALRRRRLARPRRARAVARQGRGQPPLRRGRHRDPARARGPARRCAW